MKMLPPFQIIIHLSFFNLSLTSHLKKNKASHNKRNDILHKILNKTSCQIQDKNSNELKFGKEGAISSHCTSWLSKHQPTADMFASQLADEHLPSQAAGPARPATGIHRNLACAIWMLACGRSRTLASYKFRHGQWWWCSCHGTAVLHQEIEHFEILTSASTHTHPYIFLIAQAYIMHG